jgi:Coenzyme PQQ synthesis protein D (PqqD)
MLLSAAAYMPAANLLSRDLDGEMVLLDVATASYFSLNRTGTYVWGLLAERRPIAEIGSALAARHDLPASQAAADLSGFLEELLSAGLIQPAE